MAIFEIVKSGLLSQSKLRLIWINKFIEKILQKRCIFLLDEDKKVYLKELSELNAFTHSKSGLMMNLLIIA